MRNLKVGIIGLNGIGSYFVRGLSELIKKDINGFNKINPLAIDLIDDDIIEEKNLLYTIYDVEHIGSLKCKVLEEITGYKAIDKKIETKEELSGYDFIILCVDNNKVRNLVYETNIPFLDLRAKGKAIMAFLTQKELDTAGEYKELTIDDGNKGGCQYENDIEERDIELGNIIVSSIGLQFFADYLREEITNKKLIITI